jgi:hypothetical protein
MQFYFSVVVCGDFVFLASVSDIGLYIYRRSMPPLMCFGITVVPLLFYFGFPLSAAHKLNIIFVPKFKPF